jgi:hypothetical protein
MTVWKVSLAALAMSLSLGASAQGSKQSDPTDSSAPVPPTKYESAFFGYQPYREEKIQSWRDVNDTVRRAGAEARHESTGASAARQPAPASQGQPPSTPALPAPPGHSGHGTHGK